jgi:hypothetical protein
MFGMLPLPNQNSWLELRAELERFEDELKAWLETKAGRFAVYYAAWQRAHRS